MEEIISELLNFYEQNKLRGPREAKSSAAEMLASYPSVGYVSWNLGSQRKGEEGGKEGEGEGNGEEGSWKKEGDSNM